MNRIKLAILAAALAAPCAAGATTVDFEAQGVGAPAAIQPNIVRSQTLTVAGATFSGGAVIVGTDDFLDPDAGDLTAAYTTMPYTSFANPLTISFGSAVGSLSFQVVNNIRGTYAVTVNGGAAQTYALGDYASQTISLAGAISKVTIGYTGSAPAGFPAFDFAIDNVTFASVAAAVPEPSAWTTMIAGLLFTGAALRRRRTASTLRLA